MTRFLARMAMTVVVVFITQVLASYLGEPEPGLVTTALLMAGGALVAMMYERPLASLSEAEKEAGA